MNARITGNPLRVILGLIRILEGLMMVLSFGIARPHLELLFLIWNARWMEKD